MKQYQRVGSTPQVDKDGYSARIRKPWTISWYSERKWRENSWQIVCQKYKLALSLSVYFLQFEVLVKVFCRNLQIQNKVFAVSWLGKLETGTYAKVFSFRLESWSLYFTNTCRLLNCTNDTNYRNLVPTVKPWERDLELWNNLRSNYASNVKRPITHSPECSLNCTPLGHTPF